MRITSLRLHRFRSFVDSGPIEFDRVNVLVGQNNSGKSSVLKALHLVQDGTGNPFADVRVGTGNVSNDSAEIHIGLADVAPRLRLSEEDANGVLEISLSTSDRIGGGRQTLMRAPSRNGIVSPLPNVEPHHFVVPFFSKRKTSGYDEDVREKNAKFVASDLSYLPAKLSRLSNPSFPGHARYAKACEDILGFVVTAVPSTNGQRAGVYLSDRETLFIDQMGEGVPNIVGLLADLTLSDGKLFLIEEPENDLHPKALKALLDLIIESSGSNQFVVSTHSNIVVRYLTSMPGGRLFNIVSSRGQLPPVSTIHPVEPTAEARLAVLRDLGYSFADFDLWDGWLILEEATAERLVRDYLIPWFAPKLARVRTLSAGGTGGIAPAFADFRRLVTFTHLERAYRGAAWVRTDGDSSGKAVVDKLKTSFVDWPADRFATFSQPQFEHYYPVHFSARIDEVLAIADRKERRIGKAELLSDVRAWLDEDEQRGKNALNESAAEIINDLRNIEAQLLART